MQTRFFVLMAVGKKSSDQMNNKIDRTAMARVLNLRNIFELVDNGLDNGSFAQQQFIRKVHEMVFHVFTQSGDELKPLFKEQVRQGSGNIAAIPEQLATQMFDHASNGSAIIDVARSQATGKQFTLIIDSQVQLEAVKPAHTRFPSPGIQRKDTILADPFRMTNLQRGSINETYACAGPIAVLQVGQHRNQPRWNKSDEARITPQLRKFACEIHLNMFGIIGFERPRVRVVKMDQNGHHLAWTKLACPFSPLACFQLAGFPLRCKV